MKGLSKAYYLTPVKIIRDSVHGYINLTRFDLELIDTIAFQRLSDVRQLTCQHVYPGARHTRFEHSLGVLELMRSSIKYLNRNRFLTKSSLLDKKPEDKAASGDGEKPPLADEPQSEYSRCIVTKRCLYRTLHLSRKRRLGQESNSSKTVSEDEEKSSKIDESLEFNASVAALLHDVGHCLFSHMGETQFVKKRVRASLVEAVKTCEQLRDNSELIETLEKAEKIGAVHEQLSCIVILKKYQDVLLNLAHYAEDDEESCDITVDFELIIRSILGIEYKVGTTAELEKCKFKNVIVRLLNSKVFDVDKLDYIMRDSHLTGIGTPSIDTQRLFRNMYLDDINTCNLVFTSKAVPALQNMIDARDGLYLYVYNHHAVVYSDFLNTYISRRLAHNYEAFDKLMNGTAKQEDQRKLHLLALVPKPHLFSVDAVVAQNYSDSAWLSLLNSIHNKCSELLNSERRAPQDWEEFDENSEEQKAVLIEKLRNELDPYWKNQSVTEDEQDKMARRIYNTMRLIHQYMMRRYLKPWWKTVFEFSNFMNHHFRDDDLRTRAGKYICDKGDYGLEADEMRSQIAKHVVYITQQIEIDQKGGTLGLIEHLYDGDFFVIQRATNFFSPDSIKGLEIALKNNEFLGAPANASRQIDEYYLKTLTNIIPQKDYSSIYAKEGFYVFSKQPHIEMGDGATKIENQKRLEKHYELLEEIFVFVVKSLIRRGEQNFIETFPKKGNADQERDSKKQVYEAFMSLK